MKKTFALFAAIIALASCKSAEPEQTTASSDTTAATTTVTTTETSSSATESESETSATSAEATVIDTLYEAVTKDRELPILMPPFMEEMVPDYIGDVENTESYLIEQAAISAILTEIIIVEAKDGKVDDVYGAVDAHFTALKNADNLYPQGMRAVAAAVIGKSGNIVWFICHEDAADMEQALKDAL